MGHNRLVCQQASSNIGAQFRAELHEHINNIEANGARTARNVNFLQRNCEEIADQHAEAASQFAVRNLATERRIGEIEGRLQEACLATVNTSPQIDDVVMETRMEVQNQISGFEVMALAAEQSLNTVLQNFETLNRRNAEMTSCIEEVKLQTAATERRMEEMENKIDTTMTLDCTTFTPSPSAAVVETIDESTVNDNPSEELRILDELKSQFDEVLMENSENNAFLHSKLDEELRAEIMTQANISAARGVVIEQRLHQIEEKFEVGWGSEKEYFQALIATREDRLKEEMRKEIKQHVDNANKEVKHHPTSAQDLHKDMKYPVGRVEVEFKPLAHEVEVLRGSRTEAALVMREPKKCAEFSRDSLPPKFVSDKVRAKLERLVHEVESTFTHQNAAYIM